MMPIKYEKITRPKRFLVIAVVLLCSTISIENNVTLSKGKLSIQSSINSAQAENRTILQHFNHHGNVIVKVWIEDTTAPVSSTFLLPIYVDTTTGLEIEAFEFTLNCDDTTVLTPTGNYHTYGTLSENWNVYVNQIACGSIIVGAYSMVDLSGQGKLIFGEFSVLESALVGDSCQVRIVDFTFNEGQPSADLNAAKAIIKIVPETFINNDNCSIDLDNILLAQNHPNPFNSVTSIRLYMRQAGNTSLRIYNITGQLIRDLINDHSAAGFYEISWDGRDAAGYEVASGIYFCRFKSGEFTKTVKMICIK